MIVIFTDIAFLYILLQRDKKKTKVSIYSRNLFPDDFPTEFSLAMTLKLASVTRRETWDLVNIANVKGETDFAVRFSGELKQIQLIYRDKSTNALRTAEFDKKNSRNVSVYLQMIAPTI